MQNIEALTAFRDALVRSKALANVDFTFNLIEPEGANILLPALAPVRRARPALVASLT
jgi:hypothetical protein